MVCHPTSNTPIPNAKIVLFRSGGPHPLSSRLETCVFLTLGLRLDTSSFPSKLTLIPYLGLRLNTNFPYSLPYFRVPLWLGLVWIWIWISPDRRKGKQKPLHPKSSHSTPQLPDSGLASDGGFPPRSGAPKLGGCQPPGSVAF